jgi:hypothetical protein
VIDLAAYVRSTAIASCGDGQCWWCHREIADPGPWFRAFFDVRLRALGGVRVDAQLTIGLCRRHADRLRWGKLANVELVGGTVETAPPESLSDREIRADLERWRKQGFVD